MTRTNKRHSNVHIILTAEDRMRFTQFINILIAIDRRTNIVKKRPKQKKKRNADYGSQLLRAEHRNPFANPQPMLKIELSLPKLYFGNNFEELQKKIRLKQ